MKLLSSSLWLWGILLLSINVLGDDQDNKQRTAEEKIGDILGKALIDYDALPIDSLEIYVEDGNSIAQFVLARRLMDGTAGTYDSATAIELLHLSANHGHYPALEKVADIFFNGIFVRKNIDSALYWTTRAANMDWPPSQTKLASYTMETARTSEDSSRSYMWARMATHNVGSEAEKSTAESFKNRIGNMLTAEQRTRGDSLLTSYLAARLKNSRSRADSVSTISNMSKAGMPEGKYLEGKSRYYNPSATEITKLVGFHLLRDAADAGYGPAAYQVGEIYLYPFRPIERNIDSAVYWLRKAIAAGDPNAAVSLGKEYVEGLTLKKNVKEGARLLKLAASQNSASGIKELGNFYWSDVAPKKNAIRAWALLKAAEDRLEQVNIVFVVESKRKLKDKDLIEAEQLLKDLNDETKIKAIVESWKD